MRNEKVIVAGVIIVKGTEEIVFQHRSRRYGMLKIR